MLFIVSFHSFLCCIFVQHKAPLKWACCLIDNPDFSLPAGGDVKQITTKNQLPYMIEVLLSVLLTIDSNRLITLYILLISR